MLRKIRCKGRRLYRYPEYEARAVEKQDTEMFEQRFNNKLLPTLFYYDAIHYIFITIRVRVRG